MGLFGTTLLLSLGKCFSQVMYMGLIVKYIILIVIMCKVTEWTFQGVDCSGNISKLSYTPAAPNNNLIFFVNMDNKIIV